MAKVFRYRINNMELLFDDMIYTDPNIGNDTTGNGTVSLPYKTIQKATSMVNKNNTAIILAAGTYNETPWKNTFTDNGPLNAVFNTLSYSITFIGQGLSTNVTSVFNAANCAGVIAGNANLQMYNIVLNIDCVYAGSSISNTFVGSTYSYTAQATLTNCILRYVNHFGNRIVAFCNRSPIVFNNCIIDMGSTSQAYGFSYSWYNNNNTIFTNCIFKNISNWASYGTATATVTMYNCMLPNINNLAYTNGGGNILYDPIFDDHMNIINTDTWKNAGKAGTVNSDNSISHLGIYGGTTQWALYTVKPADITINNYAARVNKNQNYDFSFSINAPFIPNTMDIKNLPNGSYGNNTITYTYPLDKTIWTSITGTEII